MIIDREKLRMAAYLIIAALGEDPQREGLLLTPARVARDWPELFEGYEVDPHTVLDKTFSSDGYDEMIIREEIDVMSTCEHHLLPFRGKAWVGYVPIERIVGLDKIDKLVHILSRRLQNQERLTVQIADAIQEALNPLGVMVVIKAYHDCMRLRGIRSEKGLTTTSALRGVFREQARPREEFLSLTGLGGST